MTAEAKNPDVQGTRIFPRPDRHDRITDRRGKKIEHLDQRLSRLEKRGLS
jgi:hypothetical protein